MSGRGAKTGLGLGAWMAVIAITLFLALLIRAYVFQAFKIPSASMMPTLLVGDLVVVNKLSYGVYVPGKSDRLFGFGTPERGDIVVFYRFSDFESVSSEKHYIKRVVAIPGDTVEIREGITYVNGRPMYAEDVLQKVEGEDTSSFAEFYGPITLENGKYFVLGDNLRSSQDSRYFGPISFRDIEGRADLIYWSWAGSKSTQYVRWSRIGKWLTP